MSATFTDEGMRLYWVKGSATPYGSMDKLEVADFALADFVDISDYAVVGGCEFVEADPDTIDEKVYSDKGKVTAPTLSNYTGKGLFRRDRDSNGKLDTGDVVKLFTGRKRGYIIKRLGIPESVGIAAGQDYEYFRFVATRITTVDDASGGYDEVEVGFLQDGDHGFGEVQVNHL